MKRLFLAFLLLLTVPAHAEDLVSGISQDIIQITSNYTGTDIVVFGAIEDAGRPRGRNIVVVVRGPGETMTVRRRDRIAGVWVNRDAAHFEGLPAYYYLASTAPLSRIAPREALARYGIGLQELSPSQVGSHHDPEPFRQAAIRWHQRAGLYAENPGSCLCSGALPDFRWADRTDAGRGFQRIRRRPAAQWHRRAHRPAYRRGTDRRRARQSRERPHPARPYRRQRMAAPIAARH